jgi:hypothetical protein
LIKTGHFKITQVHQQISATGAPKQSFIKALTKHNAAYSPLLLDKPIQTSTLTHPTLYDPEDEGVM